MNCWEGKVAVVTGGSAGIGKSICEHFINRGLTVVGLARREQNLKHFAKCLETKKGSFYPLKTDISKESDVLNAFRWISENIGIVHILVNNAGVSHVTDLLNGNAYQWKEVLDTNLLGLCIASREAIKIMRTNKVNGHIININSVSGHAVNSVKNLNVYPASKHGVTAVTETIRQELVAVGSKIKVTSISPGFVKTELAAMYGTLEDGSIPVLLPEDVAQAVLYVLNTPLHVQIHELIIRPVGEKC